MTRLFSSLNPVSDRSMTDSLPGLIRFLYTSGRTPSAVSSKNTRSRFSRDSRPCSARHEARCRAGCRVHSLRQRLAAAFAPQLARLRLERRRVLGVILFGRSAALLRDGLRLGPHRARLHDVEQHRQRHPRVAALELVQFQRDPVLLRVVLLGEDVQVAEHVLRDVVGLEEPLLLGVGEVENLLRGVGREAARTGARTACSSGAPGSRCRGRPGGTRSCPSPARPPVTAPCHSTPRASPGCRSARAAGCTRPPRRARPRPCPRRRRAAISPATVVDLPPPVVPRIAVCRGNTAFACDGTPTSTPWWPTARPSRTSPPHFSTFAASASSSTNTGLFGSGRSRGGVRSPLFSSSPRIVT